MPPCAQELMTPKQQYEYLQAAQAFITSPAKIRPKPLAKGGKSLRRKTGTQAKVVDAENSAISIHQEQELNVNELKMRTSLQTAMEKASSSLNQEATKTVEGPGAAPSTSVQNLQHLQGIKKLSIGLAH